MVLRRYISILMAFFCILVAEDVDAQRRNKYQMRRSKNRSIAKYRGGRIIASKFRPYSYVGASVNALNYFGDLAPVNKAASTDISFTRPGFGLFWGRKFHHSMSFRAAFNYGRLKGDDISASDTPADRYRYLRNASFRNDIKELSAAVKIHFLPNYRGPQSRQMLNGYVFAGIAVFHHEPKGLVPDFEYQTDFNNPTPVAQAGEWVKLRDLGTEGQNVGLGKKYSPYQLAVPFGLGGNIFISQQLDVGLELGVRWLFFDHLDDVSGNYVDLSELTELGRIMSDRSLEPTGASSGDSRANAFDASAGITVGPTLKNGYWVSSTLGSGQPPEDGRQNIRGNPNSDDLYVMTRIIVTYVLGNPGKPKYR